MHKGKALIFSAPSGSGKTTMVRHLLHVRSDLRFSISATTRPPREGEVDGVHYYFIDPENFREHIQKDELVEWEQVYEDRYYGTLRSEMERIWSEGNHIVFDVDVVGGINLKNQLGEHARSIFIKAAPEVIEKRLRGRGTDTEEEIQKRLAKTRNELAFEGKFDHVILNENLESALTESERIASSFLDH